jgi:predicted phosphodiesterase
MKIALLSDIHGNLPALQAVVEHLRTQDVQHVLNLGDSLSGPLLPVETAQFLMQQNWPTLAGNHERQLLTLAPERMSASDAYTHARLTPAVWDWLRSLPATLRWQPDVLLCHGTPQSDTQYFLETVANGRTRMASAAELAQRMGEESARLTRLRPYPCAARAANGPRANPGQPGQRGLARLRRRPTRAACGGNRLAPCPLRHC